MKELVVRLEVPEEYEAGIKEFTKAIDLDRLLLKSLEHCAEVELKKELLREIASKSKLSNEGALELGDKIKQGIAKRHSS